jgi:hypothetical protein
MTERELTQKEKGLLKVASDYKGQTIYLRGQVNAAEEFLLSLLKKEMDEERLWAYADKYERYWRGNSARLGVVSRIHDYTPKNTDKPPFPAHFTENGQYLFRVNEKHPIPCAYNGYFIITEDRFVIKHNSEAKTLSDFFEPKDIIAAEAVPIVARRMKRPVIANE